MFLQNRLGAEGKHYIILIIISLGDGGSERQVILFFPVLQMANGGSERLRDLPEVHVLEGRCWDVDPGLPDAKRGSLTMTPHCLSGYHLLQPLLEDLAHDAQLCLLHKDAQQQSG